MKELLNVKNLSIHFSLNEKKAAAVENISFSINDGEILGIAGESGAGKTVTALSLLKLLGPKANVSSDGIFFNGKDISSKDKDLTGILGKEISMIFQGAMDHLDPMFTVGDQLTEIMQVHENLSKDDSIKKSEDILKKLGINKSNEILSLYPHQLSGGMAQRVIIATAIAASPSLLIADEPTSSLDVTLKNQVLKLLWQVNNEFNTSIIFISHNIQILSNLCSNIIIMYGGWIVERIKPKDLFKKCIHPYTIGLINSIPLLDSKHELSPIPGNISDIFEYPQGCRFQDRCNKVMAKCTLNEPPEVLLDDSHSVKCWLAALEDKDE